MYLRMVILRPVRCYWLFTLVFGYPIPDALDDFSEFVAALSGRHTVRSTDKYTNITVHTLIR